MEATLSRRERKKMETRQALLEAAWTLFRDQGFDNTTIREITERADVAKGTFFNYFHSKDTLLGEVLLWRFSQLDEALDVGHGAPPSPVGRIKLLLRLLHEQMIDNWPLMQQAIVSRLGQPAPDRHEAKQRLTGLLTELVGEAQAHGEIRDDVEAEIVRDLIMMTHLRHLGNCMHRGGSPPPVGNSDHVIEMLMEGLAGPGWTGSRREQ